MSSKTNPTFSSPELQNIFSKIEPGLSAYQSKLDQLSQDIRSVEYVLKAADFNLPTKVTVNAWAEVAQDAISDVESVSGTEWHYEVLLHWANPDGKGFRLYWEHYKEQGHILVEDGIILSRGKSNQPVLTERKPLIDCKVQVRLEAEPKLQDLLLEVGKAIDPAISDEIEKRRSEQFKQVMRELTDVAKTQTAVR